MTKHQNSLSLVKDMILKACTDKQDLFENLFRLFQGVTRLTGKQLFLGLLFLEVSFHFACFSKFFQFFMSSELCKGYRDLIADFISAFKR
jgi:hypothetical protein